jgi:hypothetical protein
VSANRTLYAAPQTAFTATSPKVSVEALLDRG